MVKYLQQFDSFSNDPASVPVFGAGAVRFKVESNLLLSLSLIPTLSGVASIA